MKIELACIPPLLNAEETLSFVSGQLTMLFAVHYERELRPEVVTRSELAEGEAPVSVWCSEVPRELDNEPDREHIKFLVVQTLNVAYQSKDVRWTGCEFNWGKFQAQ